MGRGYTHPETDTDTGLSISIWLFPMYSSPPLLTPLLPRSISSLPYSTKAGGKKKKTLKESATLHLRRFTASFSFLTSEILDRSSLGESKSKGQMKLKKQIGRRGNRGSGKTRIKRGQERDEKIWRSSQRQAFPPHWLTTHRPPILQPSCTLEKPPRG